MDQKQPWTEDGANCRPAGLDGTEDVLLPLSQHAKKTLFSIARQPVSTTLKISPFCHENPNGVHEVRGWVLEIPADAPTSSLPMNCSMFDGMSVVQCECSEGQILELLSHAADTRKKLGQAIHQIMMLLSEGENKRATWRRCRPTVNGVPQSLYSAFVGRENKVTLCSTEDCMPLIDSEPWIPELSPEGFIGLYHHWHPTKKQLCLYMVCQSYLPKACLEFADMVRDLGDTSCTVEDVFHSEEVQWLRQACSRNRARLLAMVCKEMGLICPLMLDYTNAQQGERMAVICTETLHHDMLQTSKHKGSNIQVLNYCSSTQHSSNGSLCCMAPWEGVWIFHGSRENNNTGYHVSPKSQTHFFSETSQFGTPYGSLFLPTMAPQVPDQHKNQILSFTSPPHRNDRLQVLRLWDSYDFMNPYPNNNNAQESQGILMMNDLAFCFEQMGTLHNPSASFLMMEMQGDAHYDPDLLVAYKRSIARLTTAIPSHPKRHTTTTTDPTDPKSFFKQRYLLFDEQVLDRMCKRGWNRGLGYTALIPLACGLCEDWWKHKAWLDAEAVGKDAHMRDLYDLHEGENEED